MHIKESDSQNLPTENDRLITIAAAHQQLGVSRSKLYRMLEEDEIPRPVKIGRQAFFSQRELQAWIADRLAARGISSKQHVLATSSLENNEVQK